jgi:hypothetical protein
MAITNKDIEKLSEVFITKEEAKQLATKKDLERYATKEDLKSLKDEILTKVNDDVLTSQDKIIKKLEDMSIEQKMAFSQYRRQE